MIPRGSCISLLFVFFLLLGTLYSANCHQTSTKDAMTTEEKRAWGEFEEFREWRKTRKEERKSDAANRIDDYSSGREKFDQRKRLTMSENNIREDEHPRFVFSIGKRARYVDNPPPIEKPALMARYIVNQADWTAVATISTRKDIMSYPSANVISVSDGSLGSGTGIPYMYLTPLDFTAQDLAQDNRATLLMTLAQGSFCKENNMDPMDPRCARIILVGRIQEIKNTSSEFDVAKNSVFERHPWLAHMPENHHFFFAKLNIASIAILDTFGGPVYVSIDDYMNPPMSPENQRKNQRRRSDISDDGNTSFENEERRFVFKV